MFAVIFEVQPKASHFDAYLQIAGGLRPAVEAIDGFLSNERFASKVTPGKLLSFSTWRDEKAVVRWRTHGGHHAAQDKGRAEVFADYHLRVGEITADSQADGTLPAQRLDETQAGEAKAVTVTEAMMPDGTAVTAAAFGLADDAAGLVAHEIFESIVNPGKHLLLASWVSAEAAAGWRPKDLGSADVRQRCVRIIRDYGLHDRREAPQFYPDVPQAAALAS